MHHIRLAPLRILHLQQTSHPFHILRQPPHLAIPLVQIRTAAFPPLPKINDPLNLVDPPRQPPLLQHPTRHRLRAFPPALTFRNPFPFKPQQACQRA